VKGRTRGTWKRTWEQAAAATLLLFTGLPVFAALHCNKSPTRSAASAEPDEPEAGPMDGREAEAWAQADGGDPGELIRLVDLVSCETLRERAAAPLLRARAVRAMAYCPDFSELPWLAALATTGKDDDAFAALDAIVEQSARFHRSVDPDDAEELHAGCVALLELARKTSRPRARRVLAIRALRMLADRGCVARGDIPADLDAK
jgi:hypothetical protein